MLKRVGGVLEVIVASIRNPIYRDIWISAGVCGMASMFFYLLLFYYKNKGREIRADVAEHLAVAFFVGLIIIVGLEINHARRANREQTKYLTDLKDGLRSYRQGVARNVFGAVFAKNVPDSVLQEMTEILARGTMKTQCEYDITFLRGKDMPPGYCILRRELSFVVKNLDGEPAEFVVQSRYLKGGQDEAADLAWLGRAFHKILKINKSEDGVSWRGQGTHQMDAVVTLPPNGEAHVFVSGDEPIAIVSGRSSFIQSSLTDGIRIMVVNTMPQEIEGIDVEMFHPFGGRVDREVDAEVKRYELKRAFLPGQGFEVSWRAASGKERSITMGERGLEGSSHPPLGRLPLGVDDALDRRGGRVLGDDGK